MLKQAYSVVFSPLPTSANDNNIYFDKSPVNLPCTDDFQTLHYHDRYEIGVCEKGEGLFLFENEVSYISEGDVVFITPKKRHYSRSLNRNSPCICRFVYIDAKVIEDLIAFVCKDNEKSAQILSSAEKFIFPILNQSSDPGGKAILTELVRTCELGKNDLAALSDLRLALFLIDAHRSFIENSTISVQKTNDDKTISAVAEYISINYDKNSTVDELAKICNLSESQLRRRFIRMYGIPPIAYKNQLRCKIAADLLVKTQMSISEISAHVGYSDISDFYRAFRKSFGISPTSYRATSQNNTHNFQ